MAGPAKKRKKNPPSTPYKGKTLDHFFGKKATPKEAPAAPNVEGQAEGHGMTDEEYARKLARDWGEEDQAPGAKPEGSNAGSKRRRTDSEENEDSELAASTAAERDVQKMEAGGSSETNPEVREANSTTTPPSPSKKTTEISVQEEEKILKTIEAIPLDSDPMSFNPGDYQCLEENWPAGRATYGLLTRAFVLVNATRSRIKIVDTLVNLLRVLIELDPESLLPAVWLATNDIGPPYENNELGIGSSIITKAITKTSGITAAALKKIYSKYGDPGIYLSFPLTSYVLTPQSRRCSVRSKVQAKNPNDAQTHAVNNCQRL
jgi:DNA ligase-1